MDIPELELGRVNAWQRIPNRIREIVKENLIHAPYLSASHCPEVELKNWFSQVSTNISVYVRPKQELYKHLENKTIAGEVTRAAVE